MKKFLLTLLVLALIACGVYFGLNYYGNPFTNETVESDTIEVITEGESSAGVTVGLTITEDEVNAEDTASEEIVTVDEEDLNEIIAE